VLCVRAVVVLAGASYSAYRVVDLGWQQLPALAELADANAPYVSFAIGSACTLAALALARLARPLLAARVARLYRQVLRRVFKSREVQALLGSDVQRRTLARMARARRPLPDAALPSALSELRTAGVEGDAVDTAPAAVQHAPHLRLCYLSPPRFHVRPALDGWRRYFQPRTLHVLVGVEGGVGAARRCALVSARVEQPWSGEGELLASVTVTAIDTGSDAQIVLAELPADADTLSHDTTGVLASARRAAQQQEDAAPLAATARSG
jgi:hypothetical protein